LTFDLINDTIKQMKATEVMHLGKNLRLKSARAALDMSQKDVAEAVGVTRQTMNAIENGDYNPSVNLCIAICRALGKTLDQLFWEDESDEKD
jgi:putative transcriptional regulator